MTDWTEEKVACAKCGTMVGALEVFPGKRCLKCWEVHFDTLSDEDKRPDFVAAVTGKKAKKR